MAMSQNSINGSETKNDFFEKRIRKKLKARVASKEISKAATAEARRAHNLHRHFRKIAKHTKAWWIALQQARSSPESGKGHDGVESKARNIFQQIFPKEKDFRIKHCESLLMESESWKDLVKDSRKQCEIVENVKRASEVSYMGRDKMKRMKREDADLNKGKRTWRMLIKQNEEHNSHV